MSEVEPLYVLVIDDDETFATHVGRLAAPARVEVIHTAGKPFARAARHAVTRIATPPRVGGVLVRADLAAGGQSGPQRAAFHGVAILREICSGLLAPPPVALYGCVAPDASAHPWPQGVEPTFLDLLCGEDAVSAWVRSACSRPRRTTPAAALAGEAAAELERLAARFDAVRPMLEQALEAELRAERSGGGALDPVFDSAEWGEILGACASVRRRSGGGAREAPAVQELVQTLQGLGALRWALGGAGVDVDQRRGTAEDGLRRVAACRVLLEQFTVPPDRV